MDHKITTLERAFQLARSGKFSKVEDIVEALRCDGYYVRQIQGSVLKRQLRNLIAAAPQQPPTAPAPASILFNYPKARLRRGLRRFGPSQSQ